MGKCIFVTGTGTDIGKTYVTGLIVKKLHDAGLKAGYYKAAVSGADIAADGSLVPGDAAYVNTLAEIGETQENLVSYVYKEAVSPHLAAQINHKPIELAKIQQDFSRAKEKYEYLTMEGSGGIICPLRYDDTCHLILDDMIKALDLGVLVIAEAGLGTINAAVLTIEHLQHCQILVKGIIFNHFHPGDIMEEDNRHMVEALTGVKVIAVVGKGDTELAMDVKTLQLLYA
jgi:dethiobiotin synthetase